MLLIKMIQTTGKMPGDEPGMRSLTLVLSLTFRQRLLLFVGEGGSKLRIFCARFVLGLNDKQLHQVSLLTLTIGCNP